MPIAIQQSEEEVRPGWWKWSVWLDGPDSELDRVECVVYHLHPTFPRPERKLTDRASGFRLHASGWGTFELGVEIRYATGDKVLRSHRLVLTRSPVSRSVGPGPSSKDIPSRGVRGDIAWNEDYSLSVEVPEDPGVATPGVATPGVATPGLPRSILLLHDLGAAEEAEGLRRSLEELGISVAEASSVAGSSWSKELVDSIRSFDSVVTISEEGREASMPVEAKIAQKLGKQVIELGPRSRHAKARDLVELLELW
jgi:hypothetical protein